MKMKEKVHKIRRVTPFDVIIVCAMAALMIIVLYPFYNSVMISFVSQKEYLMSDFLLIPQNVTLDAYNFVFTSNSLWSGFKVSTLVVIIGTAYCMLLTTALAYGLTKPFPGHKVILGLIIFTMYFSGGLIPTYLVISKMGMLDSLAALIIPAGVNTFYMIVIRNFFMALPAELEEAAKIDGANEFVIFFKIVLPLSLPVLATFGLFFAVDHWNSWFSGMMYIKSADKRPLQLVLKSILTTIDAVKNPGATQSGLKAKVFSDGVKMASAIITMLPVMIIYPFLQKYFMKGILLGAIKS